MRHSFSVTRIHIIWCVLKRNRHALSALVEYGTRGAGFAPSPVGVPAEGGSGKSVYTWVDGRPAGESGAPSDQSDTSQVLSTPVGGKCEPNKLIGAFQKESKQNG